MSIACQPHNHQQCITEALERARKLCKQQNSRFTYLRERVLELIWQSHQPTGAYDILAKLTKQEGRAAQPPTVYRALDFLMEQGLIHRIASLNAYTGCTRPENQHSGHFLICRNCRVAIELHDEELSRQLIHSANREGFRLENSMLELAGVCQQCSSNQQADSTE